MASDTQIKFNKSAHDKVAKKYEKIHTEIYNEIEQERLQSALAAAVAACEVSKPALALDIGCGAGNLSKHLLDLGASVTAADISSNFLDLVKTNYPTVLTHHLNGEDLKEIPDASFDVVATYSVLHHIPNYLKMVEEMCRVLKLGGILYIDHEHNETYWNQDKTLIEFYVNQRYSDIPTKVVRKLKNYTNPYWYIGKYRRLKNPRYQEEGDIHVWPDDHVEWSLVKDLTSKLGFEIISQMDFLLFNSKYNVSIYKEYQDQTSDMRAVMFRKTDTASSVLPDHK